ncbi:MAG TPA: CPBP family intramembrane glutamic endopeptidase [Candidatus Limnocylindrales bacterium]|nr:CPBP family intramembrane glutamic endopeptidase [Candidatus Limnocylindrales bacterium]
MIPSDGQGDLPAPPPPPSAPPPGPPPANRPGAGTFTIEGRAAPGLFLAGWLGTLIGGVVLFVSLQAADGPAKQALFIGGLVLVSLGLIAAAGSQAIERRARGVGPYAGPSPLLVFIACVATSLVLLVLLGVPLQVAGIEPDGPIAAVVGLLVQVAVYVLLIRLLVVDTGALSWRQMGVRPPSSEALRGFGIGVAWALPIILLTGLLANFLVSWFGVSPESPLPPAGDPGGIVLNLIAGAVLAPIGEELFFRGFLTTAWVVSFGATRGVILGGLLFAFVHIVGIQAATFEQGLPLALIGFAARVPIGLALGWLFVRKGTIWAPIGLHAAFNGILLVFAEVYAQNPPI